MSDTAFQSHTSRDDAAQRTIVQAEAVRRELWLDLEDSVISPVVDGWHNIELINIELVRNVIASFAPTTVNIFSFAIWNERELLKFNTFVREHLARALGVSFNLILTVDRDIIPTCCQQMGMSPSTVDFQEMSNFWSKQGAFRLCMRHHAINHRRHHPNLPLHVLLLDDAVYNERTVWPDLQTTVEQRNIDQL